jgi:hypothetical protein
MAFTATVLAWGLVDHEAGYIAASRYISVMVNVLSVKCQGDILSSELLVINTITL